MKKEPSVYSSKDFFNPLLVLKMFLKKKIQMALIIFVTTLLFVIYAFWATPWYEATVKLIPPSKQNSIIDQYANLAAMAGINLPSAGNQQEILYPEIINSNYVLDKLLTHKFRAQEFSKPVTLFEFWGNEVDSSTADLKLKAYEHAKKLIRTQYMSASIDKESNMVTLRTRVPKDPVLAADMANYIVELLDRYFKTYRKYKATEQRRYIEKSILETTQNMKRAEKEFREFQERNRDLNAPDKKLRYERLETELQVQRTLYIELRKQLEITKIEEVKETELVDVLENATVPYYRASPKRFLLLIAGLFIGTFLAVFVVLGQNYWSVNKHLFSELWSKDA